MSLRKLVEVASEGNFDRALRMIKSEEVELDSYGCLKVLVSISSACHKNDRNTIVCKDLHQLLNEVFARLNHIDEKNLYTYFHSLFFIVKHFIDQNSFDTVIKMEKILTRYFSSKVNGIETIYLNICKLVHNSIIKARNTMCENVEKELFCKMCMFSLQIYSKVLSAHDLADKFYLYIHFTNHLNMKVSEQEALFKKYMQVLKNTTLDEGLLYASTIKGVMNLTQLVFDKADFEILLHYYQFIKISIEKYCRNPQYWLELRMVENFFIFSYNLKSNSSQVNFDACLNDLNYCLERVKPIENLSTICDLINHFLYCMEKLYLKNSDVNMWQKIIPESTLRKIFEIVRGVAKVYLNTPKKCCECKIEIALSEATYVLLMPTRLSHFLNYFTELKGEITKNFQEYFLLVQQSKKLVCKNWEKRWTNLGCCIHNTCVKLLNARRDAECVELLEIFFDYLRQLDDCEKSAFKVKILNSCFTMIVQSYLSLKEYKKALHYCALNVYLIPKELSQTILTWVKIKAAIKNSNEEVLSEITIVDILNDSKVFKINDNEKRTLLMEELRAYKARFSSKKPMSSVCAALSKLCTTIEMTNIFIEIYENSEIPMHENTLELLHKTLLKLTKTVSKNSLEQHIILLKCSYIYFVYKTIENVSENSKEMKNIVSALEKKNSPNSPVDEECDIFSSYSFLKLDLHLSLCGYLNSALRTLNDYMKINTLTKKDIVLMIDKNLIDTVIKIAQEYILHSYTVDALRAWIFALEIANSIKDNLKIIECAGHIIKLSQYKSKSIELLLNEVEKIVSLMSDVDNKANATLAVYYVNVGLSYLYWEEIEKACLCYQKAFDYYGQMKGEDSIQKFVKVNVDYLHFKLLILPCNISLEEHKTVCLGKIHRCFQNIREICTNTCASFSSSVFFILLFEVAQTMVHLYKWMRLPRELRCYGKEATITAQTLVIPLRVSYFLAQLGFADLLCLRFDDCQVKVDGISHILCLDGPASKNCLNDKITGDIDELSNDLQDMILDMPLRKQSSSNLCGSPIFPKAPFKLPDFLNHKTNCDCFSCLNTEFYETVLMKIHLDAEVNLHQNNIKLAQDCYLGAAQLVNKYKYRETHRKNLICKITNKDILPRGVDSFNETYSTLLLHHANNLMRTNNKKSALKINDKLIKWVSEKKLFNTYLYNEAFLQKLNLMVDSVNLLNIPKVCNQSDVENTNDNASAKTPENKVSKVMFRNTYSPVLSPPKRLFKAKQKIDFSNSDDEKEKSPQMVTARIETKTPKIKIYEPSKSVKKKKQVPSLQLLMDALSTPAKDDVMLNTKYTPVTLNAKSERALRSRTKVLTDKLKKERICKITTKDEIKEVEKSRKNLFSSLNVASEDKTENEPLNNRKTRKAVTIKRQNDDI